jgi:hypothetical protein
MNCGRKPVKPVKTGYIARQPGSKQHLKNIPHSNNVLLISLTIKGQPGPLSESSRLIGCDYSDSHPE